MSMTLKERRLLAGMTQTQLAEKAGLSQVAISLFENGQVNVIPAVAVKLSKALDCSPTEVLSSQAAAIKSKSVGGKTDPRIKALLDMVEKAAAVHPLAGAAVAKEAIRLHKAATKAKQPKPDRDTFGRKRPRKEIKRDRFGRVIKK